MSERCVRATYDAIFALIDIQEIWRKTRPAHDLESSEKEQLLRLLSKARGSLDSIEEEYR